ncbi:MAG: ribosome recycling factor [Lachnospiraceae bacterium]|nr:ribosome recycling factor [Lachnospiraceae bacterium]
METVLAVTEEKMQKTVQALESDFSMIRAGRANPNLLNKISVSYYGVMSPLQQVANISVPEARIILIQPWDKKLIKDIEKAILASDIGITPSNDGNMIRLVFPELTGERRQELVKDIRMKAEASKVAIRNIRRDAIDSLKKMNKNSEITEDDLKDGEERAQKLTDMYVKNIDTVTEAKAKEITTV